MTIFYKRKLYRNSPIKLNWFDRAISWTSRKSDVAADWMNDHPFICGFAFTFAATFGFFVASGV